MKWLRGFIAFFEWIGHHVWRRWHRASGKITKRIDSVNREDSWGVKFERFDKSTPVAVHHWILHLPGHHAFWDYYFLTAINLAEMPGVPPAKKRFPEATHEVLLAAVNPDMAWEELERGKIDLLQPINYVVQVMASDAEVLCAMEEIVTHLVNGYLPAEPVGVRGARKVFADILNDYVTSSSWEE